MNPHGIPHDRFRHEHICSIIHPNVTSGVHHGIQVMITIDPKSNFQGQDYHYHAVTMGINDVNLDTLINKVIEMWEPEEDENDYEPDYGDPYDDDYPIDGVGFADPGGRSSLRAATEDNPRDQDCPSCGAKNVLTRIDRQRGYRCDRCADRAEGRMCGDY